MGIDLTDRANNRGTSRFFGLSFPRIPDRRAMSHRLRATARKLIEHAKENPKVLDGVGITIGAIAMMVAARWID